MIGIIIGVVIFLIIIISVIIYAYYSSSSGGTTGTTPKSSSSGGADRTSTPEEKTPEEKTPEEKTPEEKTPEEKTPEEKTPDDSSGSIPPTTTTPAASGPDDIGVPLVCPDGKSLLGLICYDNCPDGYENDGTGICYKKCPADWEGTSTITHCQKQRVGSSVKGGLVCPAGQTLRGALCYDNCPAGYDSDGTNGCYKSCPAGWEGTSSLGHCQKVRTYSPAKVLSCPAGKTLRGALCYDNCPAGYDSDGTNGCYKSCPAGWEGTSSLAYCEKKRVYSPAKTVDHCPDGYENFGGICYKKCPAGSKRTAACTCDFGPYGGVYTNCMDNRITSRAHGAATPEFGEGYRKSAACSIQKGGIFTDCASYGQTADMLCPAGHTKRGALCYADCGAGRSRLDGDLEYCSTTCAPGFGDIGISCKKPTSSVTQAALTAVGVCPGGERRGALCYANCGVGKSRSDLDLEYCGTTCQAGFVDIGAGGCVKPSSSVTQRALTESGVCPAGQEKKGLLCYDKCTPPKARSVLDLEYCGTECPNSFVDIGAGGCERPSKTVKGYNLTDVGVCSGGRVNRASLCYKR
jgi:hypothetical protein